MFITSAIYIGLVYKFGIQNTFIGNLNLIKFLILTPMLLSAFIIDYKMKIITFLLPAPLKTPAGGYKVVYEYANRLVDSGFKVNIVYPYFLYDIRRSYIANFK